MCDRETVNFMGERETFNVCDSEPCGMRRDCNAFAGRALDRAPDLARRTESVVLNPEADTGKVNSVIGLRKTCGKAPLPHPLPPECARVWF